MPDSESYDPSEDANWCIDMRGKGFEHGIEDREFNQRVRIRGEVSSKMLKAWLKEENMITVLVESRPSIEPTHQESSATTSDETVMLLVGLYVPEFAGQQLSTKAPNAKSVSGPDDVKNIRERPGIIPAPLRVATPMREKVTSSKLYVLVDQREVLCSAVKTDVNFCFFFIEFRDLSKSKQAREKMWKRLVREAATISDD